MKILLYTALMLIGFTSFACSFAGHSFFIKNHYSLKPLPIQISFVILQTTNNKKCIMNKDYTLQQEQVARFAKATISQHLKELKEAGLIQGEMDPPKVKYCINRENWKLAKELVSKFFNDYVCQKEC